MAAIAEVPGATDGPATATIVAPPRATKEPVLNIAPIKKKATKKPNVTWRLALRDESVGLASGEYYQRRGWGGYYGDNGGRRYQNWW